MSTPAFSSDAFSDDAFDASGTPVDTSPAFSFDAFSDDAFDTGITPGFNFPVSSRNPSVMAKLGYTSTQTLLYDYGDTEDFYVYIIPPEVASATLYYVGSTYASRWFGLNGSNGLKVVYNPFLRVVH